MNLMAYIYYIQYTCKICRYILKNVRLCAQALFWSIQSAQQPHILYVHTDIHMYV